MTTAWAPGATWKAISSRCMLIASLLQAGITMPARLSFKGADRAEDPCRGAALIPWRRWPGAAPCPSPGQLGLLANSCLVLPPQLYGRSSREAAGDARQTRGEAFLKSAMSSVFWPLWRGRAESLREL